jgi:hypothetical protein
VYSGSAGSPWKKDVRQANVLRLKKLRTTGSAQLQLKNAAEGLISREQFASIV